MKTKPISYAGTVLLFLFCYTTQAQVFNSPDPVVFTADHNGSNTITEYTPDYFDVRENISPTLSSTNPSSCFGTGGSITIGDLVPGSTYELSYTDDGVPVGPLVFVANSSGQISITGLNAGFYSGFALTIGGVTTNLFTGVILSDPVFVPTFTPIAPFCAGTTAPVLPATSNNGLNGTWSPAIVNNQSTGNYTFTPSGGQCAVSITITITVTPRTTPTFPFGTNLSICAGGSVPVLPNISANGINGSWDPAIIDDQHSGVYTFTPGAGLCANPATLTVTVNPNVTPTFSFGDNLTICAGETVPTLPTTSSNGIAGTWSPSVVSNQNSNTYVFTPAAGLCATTFTYTVTVNPTIVPTFSLGTSFSTCAGATVPTLPATSLNGITGTWSPAVINNQSSGNYTFTPTGGQCAVPVIITVTIIPKATPSFSFGTSLSICAGGAVPALPNTSVNGINGTWDPAIIDDQHSGVYTFTPDAGLCANPATLTVTVNPNVAPTFSFGDNLTICAGETVPTLPTTSSNGIAGTWSPSVVSNQNSNTYVFTPAAGLCATPFTFTVTVNPTIIPAFSFAATISLCSGSIAPTLPTTSLNGITGTWSPSIVSNQVSGVYTFTPSAGQCSIPFTFTVTVNPNIVPAFSFGGSLAICEGGVVPALPATSSNGIAGAWSPSVVDNTHSGVYTFTPDAGLCATIFSFTVTVNPNVDPVFSFGNSLSICEGAGVPVLPAVSSNGITGTWSPATIDNQHSGSYTFTSNAGQCVLPGVFTLTVTVTANTIPVFSFGNSLSICAGAAVPVLPTTSLNGLTGTWTPSVISNQASGVYVFTATGALCTLPYTFTVTVNPVLTPAFSFGSFQSVCVGSPVPVLPAVSLNGITGTWSPSIVDNLVNGSYTFTPLAGQCATTAGFTIEFNTVPSVNNNTDTLVYDGAVLPEFNFIASPGAVINWVNSNPSIGLPKSGSGNVPSFVAVNHGTDTAIAHITVTPANNGCSGTAQGYTIKVVPLDKDVFVPNVFSPNHDGKNDLLLIYGNYIDKVEMYIFNQWGQRIAMISSRTQGWDGTYKGTEQPVGVYVYVLRAVLIGGSTIDKKGSITLIR